MRAARLLVGIALVHLLGPATFSTAEAQTTSTIRGTVVADDGLPLEDVEIVVRGLERTVFSNATGLYRFNEVPVGQQVVIARRPGYEAVERVVTIAAGQIALVDFRLVRMPQQLDSVTVTGERFQPVLIGYVHDTFGRPVVGAEVLLGGVVQRVQTNARGSFRIDSLEARRYQLTVRLPGFAAAHSMVEMSRTQPTEVALRMQAFAQDLGTIEVDADRRGLYGIVATPDLKPIVGARVRVYGGGTSQLSDSAGRFAFPNVKPGDYLVAAEVNGLTGRTLQVEMPKNGRREVVLTLEPVNPMARRVPGATWRNHDRGLALAFTSSLNRINRSELARFAGRQLCDIARVRAWARGSEAGVVVDGDRLLNPWSLCAFNADELAFVSFGYTCIINFVTYYPPAGLRCVYVWTR